LAGKIARLPGLLLSVGGPACAINAVAVASSTTPPFVSHCVTLFIALSPEKSRSITGRVIPQARVGAEHEFADPG
jgi:hypothetical protein